MEIIRKENRLIRNEGLKADIVLIHQLFPGLVRCQKSGHSRHGIDRCRPSPHDFSAQVDQTRVMTDMSMGEEDTTEPPLWITDLIEAIQLARELGGAVQQPTLLATGIDES